MNTNQSFSRFTVIGSFLTLAGLFMVAWMIRIQTSDSAKIIRENGKGYLYEPKTVYPERGAIYDRWGHLLAGSTEIYELGADLRYVDDPQTIAMTVANLFGLDSNEVYQSLTIEFDKNYPRYVVITKNASPEKIEELKIMKKDMEKRAEDAPEKSRNSMPSLKGLLWTAGLQRSYPEHTLASTLLGFYAFLDPTTGSGYFGVEEKYNHLLAGSAVRILVPVDPYLIDEPPSIPPGNSLILTIDREIQEMAEKTVDEAAENNGATSATIIIMDPRNGEILAMASTPRLDPNDYWDYGKIFPAPTPFNRGVEQTYEPGSVFKVLTMAAALDAGVVTPDTEFLDTGQIMVGGISIYNWDRGAWGPQTMKGCMQHSLNVCLAWVATQLGPTNFYNYLQRFGIGHLTGIDLAGEVNYPLSIAGDPNWYPVNLGTNSFGQGVSTTPIQMITAASALANPQGQMMAPHILRSVIENGEKYDNPTQVIGTPIKGETSRAITEMLAQSLEGEASVALVEGYRVAGKTGTAEIAGPEGYTTSLTNASFVGWGPVDDPRFIVYVWLEKPTSSPWGSVVAAPIFSEVVSKLVVLLDLPPDEVRHQLASQ